MISCTHCQTHNGLDAKFCKNCGQSLPDDQLQQAVQKHEQMVAEGYALFNAGRTEDALTTGLAAVEENPHSSNALSLLGMCYERTGRLTESLECFERVLVQNPDSSLDRIKVTQLRQSLAQHLRSDQRVQNRWALFAAAGIMLVVVAVGVFVASRSTQKAVAENLRSNSAINDVETRPFPAGTQLVQAPPTTAQSPVATPNAAPGTDNKQTTETHTSVSTQPKLPPAEAETDAGVINPVTPTIPANLNTARVEPIPPTNTADPAPTETPVRTQVPVWEPPKEEPSTIDIQVSRPSHGSGSERHSEPSGNQLQALMRTAREQFLLRRYDTAARTYEQALRAGGDSALINQRLGMCYEKTGNSGQAVSAYTRAASAFEGALNSGQGDPKRLKSGLDSCKQAIKLLKG